MEVEGPRDWVSPMPDPHRMLRLLKLPQELAEGGRIELELHTYIQEDAPTYNAISYTWGCPVVDAERVKAWEANSVDTRVMCNGRTVQVTKTLLEGLQGIIKLFPGCLLWNDALCINQQDGREKFIQITRMGEIYDAAAKVLVWLGPSTAGTTQLHQLYDKLAWLGELAWSNKVEDHQRLRSWTFCDTTAGFRGEVIMEICRLLFDMTWWTRKWTYQEFLLARTAVLICGTFAFEARTLLVLMRCFEESTLDTKDIIGARMPTLWKPSSPVRRMKTAIQLLEDQNTFATDLDGQHGCRFLVAILVELLSQTRLCKATEPRDNILSLIGLCKVLAGRLKQSEACEFIKPELSRDEMLLAIAKEAIVTVPYMSVMRFVGYEEPGSDKPSWLPNFDTPIQSPMSVCNQFFKAGIPSGHDNEYYTAGRQFSRLTESSGRLGARERLALRGVKLASVQSSRLVYEATHSKTADHGRKFSALDAMLRFCLSLPRRYWHDQAASQGLWKTLFYGSPDIDARRFERWAKFYMFSHVLNKGKTPESIVNGIQADHNIKLSDVLGFDLVSSCYKLLEEFVSMPGDASSKTTAILMTEAQLPVSDATDECDQVLLHLSGEMIGITSCLCQDGDEIWIFLGAKYPFIVRPLELPDHYQVVREAYVDGVMNGEFVQNRGDEPKWKPVWLV